MEFRALLGGREMVLRTDAGVFSRGHLDRGTALLLVALTIPPHAERLVDLGCGYGPIGLAMAAMAPRAEVIMIDPNERACALARLNADRNGLRNVRIVQGGGLSFCDGELDLVATNPPIRAGKRIVYGLMREAAGRLSAGGAFWTVVRTSQGAKSLQQELERIYHRVAEVEKGSGYRVYRAIKQGAVPPDPTQ